ncbi:hypothetical protein L6164_002535 [Bauhinia variegata]|uniref:Uncharacterized protein n=1 Tax=Bauhinia variegata TaxID=167791 RepID=A0ACB9PYN6_BAUVA|nr:hypothetical protein L6164_002535 [Bauhinia variegata]
MDCQTQLQPVELDQKQCSEFGSFSVSENDESDDDDESYIEIVLDHGNGRSVSIEDGNGEDEDEEYELRISISSTIPIPLVEDQQNVHFHNHNHSTEMKMEPMILAEADSPPSAMPIPLHPTHQHQHQRRRLKFPSVSHLFTTVSIFNLWEKRQPDHHSHSQTATQIPKAIHDDTYNDAKTRKEPSTTTANGRGSMNVMMKLLIKFPTSKIRKLLASLLKPNTKSSEKTKTIIQCYCYDKRRMVKNPSPHGHGTARSSRSSSKVLEIDLGAIRGLFSAVGLPSISKRTSWSTSSSCGPSPLHQAYAYAYTYPDDSIQSAVAYCKTSLRQTCQSDFSF